MPVQRKTPTTSRLGLIVLPLGAVALLALAAAGFTLSRGDSARAAQPEEGPPVVSLERDGLVYTYHVPTATEGLFDVAADPRRLKNLVEQKSETAKAMRQELQAQLGLQDLSELLDPNDRTVEALRSLGYL